MSLSPQMLFSFCGAWHQTQDLGSTTELYFLASIFEAQRCSQLLKEQEMVQKLGLLKKKKNP